jgi:hypothetical protein
VHVQERGLAEETPAQVPGSSASNVVGRTRAEVCDDFVMFWLREQPTRFMFVLQDITPDHMPV